MTDLHRNGDQSVGSQGLATPADGAAQRKETIVPAVGTLVIREAPATEPVRQRQPNNPRCARGRCALPLVVPAATDTHTCGHCGWIYRLNRNVMMWFVV